MVFIPIPPRKPGDPPPAITLNLVVLTGIFLLGGLLIGVAFYLTAHG